MCLKLDSGSELFSARDMRKLRTDSSGRMGSRDWVQPGPAERDKDKGEAAHPGCQGGCSCSGACVRCLCVERRAAEHGLEGEHGHDVR